MLRMWDVASGKETAFAPDDSDLCVGAVAFSPDSKMLAGGSRDEKIRLWAVSTGKKIATFEGHVEGVPSVAFSPDGRTLASGGADMTVRLWEVATGKNAATLRGHTNSVTSVEFSPDGKTLASGNSFMGGETRRSAVTGEIRLWDMATGKNTAILQAGAGEGFLSLAFSPDGKLLASGSERGTIRVWDLSTVGAQ